MTPAERQRKCRAIKRGEWHYCQKLPCDTKPNELPSQVRNPPPALPVAKETKTLPAPATTALAKSSPTESLFLPDETLAGESPRLSLPPAVADRLRSLIKRHKSGKTLSAAELAEAQGLLDIAEYFVVQRMRRQMAA